MRNYYLLWIVIVLVFFNTSMPGQATVLIALDDVYEDMCSHPSNVIESVMNNDQEFDAPVIQSNYTLVDEVVNIEGVINVDSDGVVVVGVGALLGQTYATQYRITETANIDNYTIVNGQVTS